MCRATRYTHATPLLAQLHWLPIKARIEFKILCLTFKALNGQSPSYISDLLEAYIPPRTLRSQDQCLLNVPKYKMTGFGKRTFFACAPVLWNSLPLELKSADNIVSFRSNLKTHLFKQ